jgi:hypothetical protein
MVPIIEYQKAVVERQLRASASWFFWIPLLSVINSILFVLGFRTHLFFSLGITSSLDTFGQGEPRSERLVLLGIGLIVSAMLAVIGYLGKRGLKWAFVTAMALYVLDIGCLVLQQNYLMMIFHIVALYFMYPGLQACSNMGILISREANHQYSTKRKEPASWSTQPALQQSMTTREG